MVIRPIRSEVEHACDAYRIPASAAWAIGVLPAPAMILFGVGLALPATMAASRRLLAENHLVEWMTFAADFAGGLLGIALAVRAVRRGERPLVSAFYALLGAALMLVAMEEISWGQWVFGFTPPWGLAAINRQGEFNLHNLPFLLDLDDYFELGLGVAGIVGVTLSSRPAFRKIAVPRVLLPCFAVVTVTAGLNLLSYHVTLGDRLGEVLARLLEVVELLLGAAGLLYVWLNGRMLAAAWGPAPRRSPGRARSRS